MWSLNYRRERRDYGPINPVVGLRKVQQQRQTTFPTLVRETPLRIGTSVHMAETQAKDAVPSTSSPWNGGFLLSIADLSTEETSPRSQANKVQTVYNTNIAKITMMLVVPGRIWPTSFSSQRSVPCLQPPGQGAECEPVPTLGHQGQGDAALPGSTYLQSWWAPGSKGRPVVS